MDWGLHPLALLHWRCWDGECVVFNAGSGQTHLLDSATAAILSCIELAPCGEDTLMLLAAQESSVNDPFLWSQPVKLALDNLHLAGLIEPAPSP